MLPKKSPSDYTSRRDTYSSPKFTPAAKIKVIGVGGGGCNAVKRMIEINMAGVEFWAMNTDLQVLKNFQADGIIQLGTQVTRGLGAGMSAEVGRQAAEESMAEIEAALSGADMVFITAGMGGGTGTGASPVIAEVAKRMGILTVGVCTKPFDFEGHKRKMNAQEGLERLKSNSDAVIVVPNQRLLQLVDKRTSVHEAFKLSDEVLRQAVQGISDLINQPSDINLDFADVRAIMSSAGTALMGTGRASGANEDRARQAAIMAIDSPLLEMSIAGAKGVLFNITGGKNLSMFEINEAARVINEQVDPEAKIIFGTTVNPNLQDEVLVTVIATGFAHLENEQGEMPSRDSVVASPFGKDISYNIPRFNNPAPQPAQDRFGRQNDALNSNPAPQPAPSRAQQQDDFVEDELDIPTFLRNRFPSRGDE